MSSLEKILQEQYLLQEIELARLNSPIKQYRPCSLPQRNQLLVHQSKKFIRLVTGGNQSGKSVCSAAEATYWLYGNHPYIKVPKCSKIWVLSAEYRTIKEGVYRHLNPMSRETGKGVGFIEKSRLIRRGPLVPGQEIPTLFEVQSDSGHTSTVEFISAKGGESARERFQAAAVDLIIVDEEIDEILFNEILVRLLATNGKILISATLVNSEDWIVELERRGEQGDPDVELIRLNTDYNEFLDQKQIERVYAHMSNDEQEIRRFGKSRRSQGLIYSNFDSSHVIEPFDIPTEWPKFCALDPGWRVFAGLWIAVNPETLRAFVYREMYFQNTELSEILEFIQLQEKLYWDAVNGQLILTEESEKIESRLIDPSSFKHYESGELGVGLQLANKYGLYCQPADNGVMTGIENVRQWMKPIDGRPGIQFFNNLVNLFNERRNYKFIKNVPSSVRQDRPDQPLKRSDHLMDCLRYIANELLSMNMLPFIKKEISSLSETPLGDIIPHTNKLLDRVLERRKQSERSQDNYWQ